jgi:hypothetical protein
MDNLWRIKMNFLKRCESICNKITQNIVVRILIVLTVVGIFFIGIPLLLAAIAYFFGLLEISPVVFVFSKYYVIWFLASYSLIGLSSFLVFVIIMELMIPIAKDLIEFIIGG